jgi:Pyridoxamine-phosphate oxidase
MCFHWKSLRRQVRVQGSVTLVDKKQQMNIMQQDHTKVE